MSSVLFVAHPDAGHLNPLLSIAARLRQEGHQAVFAGFGPPSALAPIETGGFVLERTRSPISSWGFRLLPWLRGTVESIFAIELFHAQPLAYARSLAPLMERHRPAVVVADFLFPGAGMAAELAGIPWVAVYHTGLAYPGPGIPPPATDLPVGAPLNARGRLLARVDRCARKRIYARLRKARQALGLPYAAPEQAFWSSPWATLVLTAEGAEAPRYPLPSCTFYTGPCLADRPKADFPWHLLASDRPRVYVTMGTIFDRRPNIFRRVLQALQGHCQLVVAAGASWPALRREHAPPEVLLFRRVPQLELLPRVDVVVSHGGNNTVTETLAAGKPLLVLPVGGEQAMNASRVEYLGAGLRGDPWRSSPQALREAVARLLGEPGFGAAAARAAQALGATDGTGTAARFVQRLMDTRQPIERPPDYPATVTKGVVPPWEWPSGEPPG